MMKRTESENARESHTNIGMILFLIIAPFMLILMLGAAIEGDMAAAAAPDVQRQGYPVVHAEFSRLFLPGFWSEGQHEYTLAVDCPGVANDRRATHTFHVSGAATTNPDQVYLRLRGPMVRRNGPDPVVTEFNTADVSTALVILELGPREGGRILYGHRGLGWARAATAAPNDSIYR